jgi:hypothetical protein
MAAGHGGTPGARPAAAPALEYCIRLPAWQAAAPWPPAAAPMPRHTPRAWRAKAARLDAAPVLSRRAAATRPGGGTLRAGSQRQRPLLCCHPAAAALPRRWYASGGATFQAFPMGLYEQPPPGGTADPVRVRAGDGPRSLTAAQIRDTTRLLRPEAVRYAPALGLLMFNAMPFVSNVRWCEPLAATVGLHDRALGNACLLAEELFFQRERSQPLALTRSRSRVAYYLTPSLLGHILGLAAATPPLSDKQLDGALRELGVQTNKVNGVKTGVSLARWRRVIRLAEQPPLPPPCSRSGTDGVGAQLAVAMLLRVLWERASTKACLATFLTTLDGYTPVLRPANECEDVAALWHSLDIDTPAGSAPVPAPAVTPKAASAAAAAGWQAWVSSGYSAVELGANADIEQAALALLRLPSSSAAAAAAAAGAGDGGDSSSHGWDWEKWAGALDRVAASLSQVQVAKPRLTVAKYGYRGLPPKPDCVEVTCREIFDLLLYEPVEQVPY